MKFSTFLSHANEGRPVFFFRSPPSALTSCCSVGLAPSFLFEGPSLQSLRFPQSLWFQSFQSLYRVSPEGFLLPLRPSVPSSVSPSDLRRASRRKIRPFQGFVRMELFPRAEAKCAVTIAKEFPFTRSPSPIGDPAFFLSEFR